MLRPKLNLKKSAKLMKFLRMTKSELPTINMVIALLKTVEWVATEVVFMVLNLPDFQTYLRIYLVGAVAVLDSKIPQVEAQTSGTI